MIQIITKIFFYFISGDIYDLYTVQSHYNVLDGARTSWQSPIMFRRERQARWPGWGQGRTIFRNRQDVQGLNSKDYRKKKNWKLMTIRKLRNERCPFLDFQHPRVSIWINFFVGFFPRTKILEKSYKKVCIFLKTALPDFLKIHL